jgi:hypothetical protein
MLCLGESHEQDIKEEILPVLQDDNLLVQRNLRELWPRRTSMTRDEQDKLALEVHRQILSEQAFVTPVEFASRFLAAWQKAGKPAGYIHFDKCYPTKQWASDAPYYLSPTIQPAREAELLAIIRKKDEALDGLLEAHARNTLYSGATHWQDARDALAQQVDLLQEALSLRDCG